MRPWSLVVWSVACAGCSGWPSASGQGDRPERATETAATSTPSPAPLRPVPACADLPPAQPHDDTAPAGVATLRVRFSNRVGSSFWLSCVRLEIDGVARFMRMDRRAPVELATADPLITNSIAPGRHDIAGQIELTGRCMGIYGYCRGYVFRVRTEHVVTAEAGGTVDVELVAYEKGSVTTPIEERPAARFEGRLLSPRP